MARAPSVRRRRSNPGLVLSHDVQAILYVHAADHKDYVHVFGGREPELRTDADGRQWMRVDDLPRRTSVKMRAVGGAPDTLVLSHGGGKEISRDF